MSARRLCALHQRYLTTSDVDQLISVPAPWAQKEETGLININFNGPKHHAQSAVHTCPHTHLARKL